MVGSFRNGMEVRALDLRVPEPVISAVNQWWIIKQDKGLLPRLSMIDHYYNVMLKLETILQFYGPL